MDPFHVETDNYRDFIERIRNRAKEQGRYSHGRPVLPRPPEGDQQPEYFDVELVGRGGVSITLKIRRHDLYVVGYRQPNGQWWEFNRDDGIHLIEGSEYIGFTENYSKMGGLDDNTWDVGYDPLLDAIERLANYTDNRRRSAMRAIVVMVSEATRYDKLLETFSDLMHRRVDSRFRGWMESLIHAWGDLSDLLLLEDHNATPFRLPRENDGRDNVLSRTLGIVTAANAAMVLGLLLGTRHTNLNQRLRRDTLLDSEGGDGIKGEGQPMVEVFSVRIINIDGEDPGDLYGTIQVTDGLGTFPLYDRKRDDSESVHPNGTASLTGPYRAISFCHYLELRFDLWDKDTDPSPDDEVSKDSLSWDYFEFSNYDCFNKRLFHIFPGKNGSAMAYYTVFRDAVQAKVEVKLINGDGEDPADVYGTLVARYSDQDYSTEEEKKYSQTVLFNKSSKETVEVKPGQFIPLARFVVAVPTTSSLIIEADLWDHDSISPDDEIAKGTAKFTPRTHDLTTIEIKGECGLIQVTVTWSQVSSA